MSEIAERSDRIAKLHELIKRGTYPYPSNVSRTHTLMECTANFEAFAEKKQKVSVAGRVRSIRRHGGSTFLVLEDGSGRMQVFLRKDTIGEDSYAIVKDLLDMGDFLSVDGALFTTKTGEKTIEAASVSVLCKALLPLPEQWHGLADVEVRYRQRYLDLIANADVRAVFLARAKLIKTMRQFFEERGFLEVETPVLQPLAGGATARPFVTHHKALDQDMYLRIAPELYLKRLVVGGFDRVFEFARCFRNEGIDHSHNPEFSMLEAYCAYADYRTLMDMMQELFSHIALELHGSRTVSIHGTVVTFGEQFDRVTFHDALQRTAKIDIDSATEKELFAACKKLSVTIDKKATRPQLLDALFKKYVIPSLEQPTFVIDYPVDLSPLAKKKATDPTTVERFQLIIAGMEVVNAFSELNDPQDQMARFLDQQKNREMGDEEAHALDTDYVTALEYGLPPTAGLGIGIDRLAALLTDRHNLKEVILFPTLKTRPMKPEA